MQANTRYFDQLPRVDLSLSTSECNTSMTFTRLHNYSTFLGRPGLYLEDLFVKPDFRGKGIGRRLLSELAALAVARGCGRLEWSVLDWNAPALGFYRSVGAVPQTDWIIHRLTGESLQALARSAADPAREGG